MGTFIIERFRHESNRVTSVETSFVQDISDQPVSWLWPSWIARGMLTVLDGDPGMGKSTISAHLAATVSRGRCMPGDESMDRPGAGVMIASAEVSASRTIRPRLAGMDADLARIRILDDVSEAIDGEPDSRSLQLPADLPLIEAQMLADGTALFIVDPLMAYIGRDRRGRMIDANREQSARILLGELCRLAETTNAAVLVIRHLNKSARRQSLYRGTGSIGITAVARSVLLVGRDPGDPADRDAGVLAMVKGNLAARPNSVRYRLRAKDGVLRIEWGRECHCLADHLLGVETPAADPRSDPAQQFLHQALGLGPRHAAELYEEAESDGISKLRLWQASRDMGICKLKLGFKDGWLWQLATEPGGDDMPDLE